MRRISNWWNIWQHYRKLAKSGDLWDRWAFNFLNGFIPEDKLKRYSRIG